MKKNLILLLFPLLTLCQDSNLTGDVDCDNMITAEDASLILQFVTSMIEELPCSQNMNGLTPNQLEEIIGMLSNNVVNSGMPTMVSTVSSDAMDWTNALIYCRNLEEGGYSDWYLPDSNELTYVLSRFSLDDEPIENQTLFTRTFTPDNYNKVEGVTLNPSTGGYGTGGLGTSTNQAYFCRCVR